MTIEKPKDGGAAFPHPVPQDCWGSNATGMSLRDWFAGQALIGIVTAHGIREASISARDVYRMADAMLSEREKPRR